MKRYTLPFIALCLLLSCQDSDSGQENSSGQEPTHSGPGYVTGLEHPDANVLFTAEVPQPGDYLLEIRYRNTGTGNAAAIILINDAPTEKQLQLPAPADREVWQSAEATVSLRSGLNCIVIRNGTADAALSELDYITLKKKP